MARPKLNDAARRLVRSLILAGHNNRQIRAALQKEGHPTIGDAALSHYRCDEQLRESLALLDIEAIQTGLMLRARRLLALNELAQNAMLHLRGGFGSVSCTDFVYMTRTLLGIFREISRLADQIPATQQRERQATGEPATPSLPQPPGEGFYLAMLNDALEELETEQAK